MNFRVTIAVDCQLNLVLEMACPPLGFIAQNTIVFRDMYLQFSDY